MFYRLKPVHRLLLVSLLFMFTHTRLAAQERSDSTKADSILMKQIEEQMKTDNTNTTVVPQPRSGISANPDIGVIGDFQGSYISRGKKNFDMYLNETEVSLQSVVDPYARADFFLSFGRDPQTGKYG